MSQGFSKHYRKRCELVERDLVARLGRPLTNEERDGVWNVGSLMMLEAMEREFDATENPEQISRDLINSGRHHQQHLDAARSQLVDAVSKKMRRRLTGVEREQLLQVANIAVAMECLECLDQWKWWRRGTEFQLLLKNLNGEPPSTVLR